MVILQIKNLSKKFGELTVLDGIDLEIKQGEHVAVIGSSGVGKTTLLRCINLLEEATSGEIILNNETLTAKNINTHRQKIGFVFQNFNLFANMTVLKNIMLAPVKYNNDIKLWNIATKCHKDAKKQIEEKALALLKKFGLSDKAHKYPHTLSGGQKQRVAIIRALINEPRIMLFDEPTSSLDPEMKNEVLETIKSLDKKLAVILVTHEISFVKNFASRVLFMDNGKIAEEGTADEIFNKPKSKELQKFLSKILN